MSENYLPPYPGAEYNGMPHQQASYPVAPQMDSKPLALEEPAPFYVDHGNMGEHQDVEKLPL